VSQPQNVEPTEDYHHICSSSPLDGGFDHLWFGNPPIFLFLFSPQQAHSLTAQHPAAVRRNEPVSMVSVASHHRSRSGLILPSVSSSDALVSVVLMHVGSIDL